MRRARWALLIAGGVLLLAITALFVIPSRSRLEIQMIARTNNVQALLVVNRSSRLHSIGAVAVVERFWATPMEELPPNGSIVLRVPVPAESRQIMVMHIRREKGRLGHWLSATAAFLGTRYPRMKGMYIDLPE